MSAETRPSCLDAQTLAAWFDGGLTREEVASVETHAADCARCQALMAAMARTTPAPLVTRRSWRRFLVPVLVPMTAATVFAIWLAVPRNEPVAGDAPERAPATAARDRELLDEKAPSAAEDTSRPSLMARQNEEVGRRAAGLRPDTAPRAEAPPAAPAAEPEARSKILNETATAQRSERAALDVLSPGASDRWRAGGARVERSTDGGLTWEERYFDADASFTAASSPAPGVCWVVGRAGVVLLTTDGRTWRTLPFPEKADLSSVRATDAMNAVVTAADGRSFLTSDAGRTWHPAPLQDFAAAPF